MARKVTAFDILALIFGIFSITNLAIFPVSMVFSILALIMSKQAVKRGGSHTGLSKAGGIIGKITLIICIVIAVLTLGSCVLSFSCGMLSSCASCASIMVPAGGAAASSGAASFTDIFSSCLG